MESAPSISNYVSLVIGSILGAGLSYIATEISARRRSNEDKEKDRKDITADIIGNCLEFLFRLKDGLNDVATKKKTYLLLKGKFPEKAREMEKAIYQAAYDKADSGIFQELMFISYQLKRIDDPSIWKDFEELGNLYESMSNILIRNHDDDFKKYDEVEYIYNNKLKSFVDKCLNMTKV